MAASIVSNPVGGRSGRRFGAVTRRSRRLAVSDLAALCDICGGRLEGGQVLVAGWTYCSLECAQSARDRTPPGHYFG